MLENLMPQLKLPEFNSRWLAAFIVVHVFIFLVVFSTGIFRGLFNSDFHIFYYYANDILNLGYLPYEIIPVEYPPLALLFFLVPGLLTSSMEAYAGVFTVMILLFDLLILLLLVAFSKKLNLNAWKTLGIYTLALLAVGSILTVRYDLIPAFFVFLSLYAFISRRYTIAWVVLALGVMTKLFPVILVPIYLIYHWRLQQKPQILAGGAAFVVTLAVVAAVPLYINAAGFIDSFLYHADRPLQVESLYSSILVAGQTIGLGTHSFDHSFGSTNLVSPTADFFATASTFITGAGLLGIYFLFYRYLNSTRSNVGRRVTADEERSSEGIIIFATLAILIFIAFGKVLSPQFIIWLLPLIPLLNNDGKMVWLLFVLVGFTTQFIYPKYYPGLEEFHGAVVGMLLARNILLLLMIPVILNHFRKTIDSSSTPGLTVGNKKLRL